MEIMLVMLKGQSHSINQQTKYATWTQQLIKEQQAIGVPRIWNGFLTQTWGDIQESHYRKADMAPQYMGTMWTHRILTLIYKRALQAWKERSEKLYDKATQQSGERNHLQWKTQHLYTKHRSTPNILPQLYQRPLQRLLKSSTRYLRRWSQIMEPIDADNKLQNKRRQRQDIRRYLPMPEIAPRDNFEPRDIYQ